MLQRVVFSIRSHVLSEWGLLPELMSGIPAAYDFIFLTVLLRMRLGERMVVGNGAFGRSDTTANEPAT